MNPQNAGSPAGMDAASDTKRRIGARVVIRGGNEPVGAAALRTSSPESPPAASPAAPTTSLTNAAASRQPPRPWIRGPFRKQSARTMTGGLIGSIGAHIAFALLTAAVGFSTRDLYPKTLDREGMTTVEVQLPRLAELAPEAAALAAAPPAPEPAGPAMTPAAPTPPVRVAAAPRHAPPASPAPKAEQLAPPPPPSGEAGRARAQNEVVNQLGDVNGSLERVLSDLSSSLAVGDARSAARESGSRADTTSRSRAIGSARTAAQIASIGDGVAGGGRGGTRAGLAGSTGPVAATGVAIAALLDRTVRPGAGGAGGADAGGEAGGRGGAASGGGAHGGEVRSNASLLATVRRYAPGIQFCYDNELKRTPGLRGKLVVSMTVAASGAVTEAQIAQDTIGSANLVACTLAQVRGWRFPEIPAGEVAFKTPFVFTPPE